MTYSDLRFSVGDKVVYTGEESHSEVFPGEVGTVAYVDDEETFIECSGVYPYEVHFAGLDLEYAEGYLMDDNELAPAPALASEGDILEDVNV